MNKEKLIAAFYPIMEQEYPYDKASELCAEAALTLMSRELQAKDTTIKEQAEQIEKLKGLLKDMSGKYLEEAWNGEKTAIVGKTREVVTIEQAKETYWQSYKEQHGI